MIAAGGYNQNIEAGLNRHHEAGLKEVGGCAGWF
jgi:hypothetical protein